MKNLYFIRHGESVANQQGLWGRSTDPLSQRGVQEAVEAGKKAAAEHFMPDLIVCSPYTRATKTATMVATEIGYPLEKIKIDERLVERNFGTFEGAFMTDILPDFNQYKLLDSYDTIEKFESLYVRAKQFLEDIKNYPEDTILIAGHAAFGRALRHAIAGEPYTAEYDAPFNQIPNAQIVRLI